MLILHFALLLISVMAGAILADVFKSESGQRLKLLLSFSGAYLLAISAMHLLPEIYLHSGHNHDIGLFIMLGFLFQIILEFFSQGIEHGHNHHHASDKKSFLSFGMLLSLCLHSLMESVPIGTQWHSDPFNSLFWGIVLHHVPIGIVLYTTLLNLGMTNKKAVLLLFIFGSMSPIGAAIGFYIPGLKEYNSEVTAFVVGMFLHISTTILFESSKNHKFNILKLGSIVIAMILAYSFSGHAH